MVYINISVVCFIFTAWWPSLKDNVLCFAIWNCEVVLAASCIDMQVCKYFVVIVIVQLLLTAHLLIFCYCYLHASLWIFCLIEYLKLSFEYLSIWVFETEKVVIDMQVCRYFAWLSIGQSILSPIARVYYLGADL